MLSTLLAVATASAPLSPVPALVELGFENVAMAQREGRIVVWYEDRRSLDATVGLGKAAKAIAQAPGLTGEVELVPLHERLPVLGVRVGVEDLRGFFAGGRSPAALADAMTFDDTPPWPTEPLENLSLGHTDWQISPGYNFSATFQGWLNSTFTVLVAPGLRLEERVQWRIVPTSYVTFPLHLVGGHWPLWPRVDLAWQAGKWGDRYWGGDAAIAGYLFDGWALWRTRASWQTEERPTAIGEVEVRYPWVDTFSRVGVGTYPAGDQAFYATFGRLFGASEVEAGAFRSNVYGLQLKASIITYLGPRERPTPGWLRIEPLGWFDFFYKATAPQAATELSPAPDAGSAWRRLTPAYVRSHLELWRSGGG